MMQGLIDQTMAMLALGGWVVGVLAILSMVALTVILFKLLQFWQARVGRHGRLDAALQDLDQGQCARATTALSATRSSLAPVLRRAIAADPGSAPATDRIEAEAEVALARLESGFRLLDAISQTAPLLGLFGTVLGMIEAFRAMQGAGASVDPSVLAGGIWVALLTTAVGLAVAIPTSLMLTWFEARVADERLWLAGALARVRAPLGTQPVQMARAHAA